MVLCIGLARCHIIWQHKQVAERTGRPTRLVQAEPCTAKTDWQTGRRTDWQTGSDSKELLLHQNGCIKQQDIAAPRQVSAGAHGVHSALPHIVTEDIDPSQEMGEGWEELLVQQHPQTNYREQSGLVGLGKSKYCPTVIDCREQSGLVGLGTYCPTVSGPPMRIRFTQWESRGNQADKDSTGTKQTVPSAQQKPNCRSCHCQRRQRRQDIEVHTCNEYQDSKPTTANVERYDSAGLPVSNLHRHGSTCYDCGGGGSHRYGCGG